jgi:hypothetical protein
MKYYIKECPHCKESILLYHNELNCKIYRHGVLKKSLKQINPHSSKEECDFYIQNNLIYGCGKPFRIEFQNDDDITLTNCDYI